MNYEVLSDVAKIIMGQSPPSSTYNTTGEGLPFFQGKADFGETYPTPRVYCSEPNRIAEPDDILITVRAPVGPTNINIVRSCIGRGLAAIRASKSVDRDFLLYFLRFYEPELARAGTGSTFAAISREDLETVNIPLPPLPEQRRIADLLRRTDHLRRLRRYADALSASLLQSVFLEIFGDTLNGKNLEIPLVPLECLCTKITDGTHVTPKYLESGIPFLSVKNITHKLGTLDFSDIKYISREEHKRISKLANVERDDILYTKVGATYGYAQIVDTDREFSIFVSVALLKPDKTKVLPKYLETVMNSLFVNRQADNLVSGIGVPDLHLREIKTFQIPLPPLLEQERFARVARRVEALRGRQAESARQGEGLFQSLLHEAFCG